MNWSGNARRWKIGLDRLCAALSSRRLPQFDAESGVEVAVEALSHVGQIGVDDPEEALWLGGKAILLFIPFPRD
jgi:hypothetical protein